MHIAHLTRPPHNPTPGFSDPLTSEIHENIATNLSPYFLNIEPQNGTIFTVVRALQAEFDRIDYRTNPIDNIVLKNRLTEFLSYYPNPLQEETCPEIQALHNELARLTQIA